MNTFDQTIESLNLEVSRQAFGVHFKYPVYFTRNIFEADNPLLESIIGRPEDDHCHKAIIYIDSTVAEMHPVICEKIERYLLTRNHLELVCQPCLIENTRICKTRWEVVGDIMATVSRYHMDRQSFIVAIGGGSLLDVVGFAGSIIHRGMRMIRVPTTTLAQADAGIGIKNGMDIFNAKNFAGTFAPPFAVVNDFAFLSTLNTDDWIGGVAEAFKVAIIKDAAFFDFLCEHAKKLKDRDPAIMEKSSEDLQRYTLNTSEPAVTHSNTDAPAPWILDIGQRIKLRCSLILRLGMARRWRLGLRSILIMQ